MGELFPNLHVDGSVAVAVALTCIAMVVTGYAAPLNSDRMPSFLTIWRHIDDRLPVCGDFC